MVYLRCLAGSERQTSACAASDNASQSESHAEGGTQTQIQRFPVCLWGVPGYSRRSHRKLHPYTLHLVFLSSIPTWTCERKCLANTHTHQIGEPNQCSRTSISSLSCIFLIHLLAWPCGSIMSGHLVPFVTRTAESVET